MIMKKSLILFFIVKIIISAAGDGCDVITMTQWAGRESLREERLSLPISLVVVQHTVSPVCNSDADCERRVQSILAFHQNVQGFTDIGQSFLIGGNGKVYEGAGWNRIGAHTRGFNTKSVGISFIGDFRDKLPTAEALAAAKSLLVCGVQNKQLKEDYHLVGHLQLSNTLSPGEALQNHIKSWPHWTQNVEAI